MPGKSEVNEAFTAANGGTQIPPFALSKPKLDQHLTIRKMRNVIRLASVIVPGVLLTLLLAKAYSAQLGSMKADRVLFLGNSITCCEPKYWGLSASSKDKDFVHLLAAKIEAQTGGTLRLDPISAANKTTAGTHTAGDANIVNIADLFERQYATYAGSGRFAKQIAWKPNIVVLQFGENIVTSTFDADVFKANLRKLVNDLKEGSNPVIFMAGFIIGSNPKIDNIKKEICAEDPKHRVFVDLSAVFQDSFNIGEYNHPSDAGMSAIADTVFRAMVAHAAPEPSCASLPLTSLALLAACFWMTRQRR
jgi:lysophospholipase L1-like esterase